MLLILCLLDKLKCVIVYDFNEEVQDNTGL